MAGRGRGRGSSSTFSHDQLKSAVGDVLPTQVTQPPPLYPILERLAVPLEVSEDDEYLLAKKADYMLAMRDISSVLTPELSEKDTLTLFESLKFDWTTLPSELKPKAIVKRTRAKETKNVDIQSKLVRLEKLEDKVDDNEEEQDEGVADEEEEMVDNEDEEMDDGTDYAQNYFDNGEGFEDIDDGLDDGPIY